MLTNKQINNELPPVRIPAEWHKKLKIESAIRGLSMGELIIKALEMLFKKIDGKSK